MDGKDLPINGEYAKLYFRENAEKQAEAKSAGSSFGVFSSGIVSGYYDSLRIPTDIERNEQKYSQKDINKVQQYVLGELEQRLGNVNKAKNQAFKKEKNILARINDFLLGDYIVTDEGMQHTPYTVKLGTDKETVENKIGLMQNQYNRLKQAYDKQDKDAFYSTYKEITGHPFNLDSYQKMYDASKKYSEMTQPAIYDPESDDGKKYLANKEKAINDFGEAYNNFFGKNIGAEALSSHQKQLQVMSGVEKFGALTATAIATWGASIPSQAAAFATTDMALDAAENINGKEDLNLDTVGKTAYTGIKSMTSYAAFGGATKAVSPIVGNTLSKTGINPKTGLVINSTVSGAVGGSAGGAVHAAMEPNSTWKDVLNQGGYGALWGGSLGFLGGMLGRNAIGEEQLSPVESLKKRFQNDSALKDVAKTINWEKISEEELQTVYRTMAMKYHPDHGGNAETFKVYSDLIEKVGKSEFGRFTVEKMANEAGKVKQLPYNGEVSAQSAVQKPVVSEPVQTTVTPKEPNAGAVVPVQNPSTTIPTTPKVVPVIKPVETPYAEAAVADTATVLKAAKPVTEKVYDTETVIKNTEPAAEEVKPAEIKPAEKPLPKTKEELIKWLKEMKTTIDGEEEPRLYKGDLDEISRAKYINSDNMDLFATIMSLKFNNGRYRYDLCTAVKTIIKQGNYGHGFTNEYIKPILELAKIKDNNGEYLFNGFALSTLAESIGNDPNKLKLLNHILSKRNSDGSLRVMSFSIPEMVNKLNDSNIKMFDYCMDAKDSKGNFKYSDLDTQFLLYEINNYIQKTGKSPNIKQQLEKYDWLLSLKDKEGKSLLSEIEARELFLYVNEPDITEKLINLTNQNGERLFDCDDLTSIIEVTDSDNIGIIENLGNMTDKWGLNRFNGKNIRNIVETLMKQDYKTGFTKSGGTYKEEVVTLADGEFVPVKSKINQKLLERLNTLLDIKELGNNQLNAQEIEFVLGLSDSDFNKQIEFYKKYNIKINPKFIQILENGNYQTAPFRTKRELCNEISSQIENIENNEVKLQLQEKVDLLKKSMDKAIEPMPVSKETNNEFWHEFLTTADKENTEVIKGLDSVVERYGQEGLPLEFSRVDFVKELKAKLDTLPEEQRAEILKKIDIQLKDNSYEGFINPNGLDSTIAEEAEIQKLCERFLFENRINTGNPQTDKFLNSIIKGMPELVNIIGKKQHGTHQYTLDGHTLKVLKEVVSNPKFETLSNQDKMITQLTALLHDIGKQEGIVDAGHEFMSSVMANDILGKVNLPEFTKKRIVELIKNHNWLQQMNEGQITPETAAVMFRNSEDGKIAEIFAEADLKGVGKDFYETHSLSIKPNIERMNNALNELYSTGNIVFPTRILNGDKIPTVEYNGQQYRVLDVSKLPEDTDLTQFGLSVKNKKDLRLIFHAGDFETMQSLTKPFNEAVICTTMISPSQKATYYGEGVGMLLDTPNSNVINSAPENQGSGYGRDFSAFVDMSKISNEYRPFQRNNFINSLSQKYQISESDYAEIYKHLIDKQYLNQIQDVTLSNGTKVKAEDLRSAYKAVEGVIMKKTATEHNEINLYNPQVKGAILIGESLSEIPSETLQFVKEHNLPIFIMGKK